MRGDYCASTRRTLVGQARNAASIRPSAEWDAGFRSISCGRDLVPDGTFNSNRSAAKEAAVVREEPRDGTH